jgi:CHAT domain-containing protein
LRIRGSRADNLERAIEAFEAALTVRTREAAPEEWAETQTNLANAYEERIRGSKADNLEAAIKAFEAALTVRTRAAFPEEWAETQNDLALTYTNRIRGSKADNLEAAIKALEAALTVLTRAAFPEKWAGAQNNLALAYDQRILGSRADNLEEAIRAYESALTVRTREAFPQQWAVTQINLSNTYRVRIRGSRADNLEEAIRASELALTVQTREDFPQLWAMAQSNRAIAYLVRIRGSQAQNLELAIKALEAALTVRTREAYPDDWATTQQNLAIAYRNRIFGTRADNLEAAIKAFEAALTVRTREAFPREHLLIGRELGQSLLDKGHWREASAVYASARAAFLLLFGQGLEETNAQDLIEKAGPIFAEAAYAAAQGGDVNVALALLTEGKGRLMAVALRQQSLDLPADERARLIALQVEIRELRPVAERVKGEEGAKALERLIALRRVLGELLAAATSSGGGDALAAARGLVPAGGALVAPIVTKAGTKLLLVRSAMDGGSVTAINLPTLTTTRLAEVMRGPADNEQVTGWLGAFNIQYLPKAERDARWLEWPATIEGISWELWRLFGGALHTALADAGVKPGARLIWMPAGALGLLPIGLAQATPDQPRLGDLYEIVTAPSLESMLAAQRQVATPASLSLALVVNPTDDLPFTEVEGQLIAGHFPGSARVKLDKSTAEPPLVLTALQGKRYWHFSSHGTFDWADARRSGLLMKDKQPLTVQALLDAQDRLGRPRLVVLSACETGLYDIDRNPEEFVGLPATFMQLGAGGVLGTLWQVDDRATALLIARFYELHLGQGLAPPTALKQAQAWLRTSSKAELIAYAKAAGAKAGFTPDRLAALEASLKRRNLDGDARFAASWKLVQDKAEAALKAVGRAWTDDESLKSRPFEHPYYWGAFVYTGL